MLMIQTGHYTNVKNNRLVNVVKLRKRDRVMDKIKIAISGIGGVGGYYGGKLANYYQQGAVFPHRVFRQQGGRTRCVHGAPEGTA